MDDIPYLKVISRVKHRILGDYLPPWAIILGSAHKRLGYVDCFAGGGIYVDEEGNQLPGSPLVALRLAKKYVQSYPDRSLLLGFIEKDKVTAGRLQAVLNSEAGVPATVRYFVEEAEAQTFVEQLVSEGRTSGSAKRIIPTFFFVDPYGHPITIPKMRELLALGQTEIFVNLMWYRINMDLSNPKVAGNMDRLFGHPDWRGQDFMKKQGKAREQGFLDYFAKEVGAKYHVPFPIRFSDEDNVAWENRTKFYLIHFSNHPKAALLMKEVMGKASDSAEELQFRGRGPDVQLKLFGNGPDLERLGTDLLQRFQNTQITFDDIRTDTLEWPFIEKNYRTALKRMERDGVVSIKRVTSKKSGLKGRDVVIFP